uniref:Endonuclease/exonuclease/phosphatase domain-containing protein n=1 Tax=Amphimedon queenslandica TaxID=400682 RepID=A0A1X7SRP6_AMPQE
MELVTVLVQIPHPVVLCLVYLPPQASANEVQSLIDFLSDLISTHNVILLGDFNFPNIDWSSLSSPSGPSLLFTEFAFRANLSQHITTPTHLGGNILDLLFSQSPDSVIDVHVHKSQRLSNFSSDHFPITFSIPHSTLKSTPNHSPSFYLDFAKCNYDAMADHLLDIDFSVYFSSNNIDYLWTFLKNILNDSIATFVPKVRRSSQKFPKWFTGQIRHHLNQLRSLRRKSRVAKVHSAK